MKPETCSLNPLIDLYSMERPLVWDSVFNRNAPLVVEIGFGMGEVLLRNAKRHKETNYLGIEQHWERIYKTVKAIDRAAPECSNIRILRMDARIAFDRLFTQKSIDHIYCLFPCPWPKKSHIKHRLFSRDFLALLNSRLKDGGEIYFVTDYVPYYQWVMEEMDSSLFSVQTSSIKPQFDTKFERKWIEEGQDEFYELVITKQKHFKREVAKDKIMKSYSLKDFSMEDFSFEDIKGKISIVLKDKICDTSQKRLMLRFIVSEQHLMQNFWVTIVFKKDRWRVFKSDGQNFLPTSGIVKTLEEVFSQAKKYAVTV